MAVRYREAAGAVIHLDDSEKLARDIGQLLAEDLLLSSPFADRGGGAAPRANPAATTRPASAFTARRSGECMAGSPSVTIGAARRLCLPAAAGGRGKPRLLIADQPVPRPDARRLHDNQHLSRPAGSGRGFPSTA
jgi:hypothetical protein